jgi:hypothetical protein
MTLANAFRTEHQKMMLPGNDYSQNTLDRRTQRQKIRYFIAFLSPQHPGLD